eukprot:GHRQ01002488.1.p1 GENE.GHRQ01002488.1~~GHRQ01002488.1.p1  ORF type:complete len:521 (+),score=226.11 GHRQ01002488.1:126-1688(+)
MELAWHESEDIVRGVLGKLQSNRDLLSCDLVCKRWKGLQHPLPRAAQLTADQAMHKSWLRWLSCNAHRLTSLALSGCTDSMTCNKQMWSLLSEAQGLQKLQFRRYKALSSLPPCVVNLTSLRELCIICKDSSGSSNSNGSSCGDGSCSGSNCSTTANSDSDNSNTAGSSQANGTSCRQFKQLQGLQELPEELGSLKQLQRLKLDGCRALATLPDSISGCSSLTSLIVDVAASDNPAYDPVITVSPLKELPASLGQLPHLQQLILRGCNALRSLPDAVGDLSSLTQLRLEGCHSLKELPGSLVRLQALRSMEVDGANSLEVLPEGIGGLASLTQLSLSYCHHLQQLPECLGKLQHLRVLDIGCHGLVDHLPATIGNLPELQHLTVDCATLNDLPDSISQLTTLTWLAISHCLGLQQLPEGLGNLQQLRVLIIDTIPHVDSLPQNINLLESLEELHLLNDSEYDGLPQLPRQMDGLTSLTKLRIGTVPGIEHELPSIPGSIGVLENLRELQIGNLRLVAARD